MKIYWTDAHSNIHHDQMDQLPQWFEQVKEVIDFWPIAYYPYQHIDHNGLSLEDLIPPDQYMADWRKIQEFCDQVNAAGYPMFMGYEWQGNGLDGDHNVFFKQNDYLPFFPLRYTELYDHYRDSAAIAIPHHPAYQLGYRGKNWATQIDAFSPFAEIYSSHGCSERDDIALGMDHHVHMGPRTSATCGQRGYDLGFRYGLIASGDNHVVPAAAANGLMACLAASASKEDLWDALVNRRVYGVSGERIQLDFQIDGYPLGSIIKARQDAQMQINVIGSNALDRIEIIADNQVIDLVPHLTKPQMTDRVIFKFKLECGWGPNRRYFPELAEKGWEGKLSTKGRILSVERCFNTFGQQIRDCNEHSCSFALTTHKGEANGGWMGIAGIVNEGLIFEIDTAIDDELQLELNGHKYPLAVRDILNGSVVYPLMEETAQLLAECYDLHDFYRHDAWWHNAYKFKIHQGAMRSAYVSQINRKIDLTGYRHLRVRVWQRNGSVAWSSPIFMED